MHNGKMWYRICGGLSNFNVPPQRTMRLEAVRIMSRLPVLTKLETLYTDIGWESLADRRMYRRLQMFYKIQNQDAPEYSCRLTLAMV